MYHILLFSHAIVRWLVLICLLYSLFRAYRGYFKRLKFTPFDAQVRLVTITIVHLQLLIGIILYTQSPVIQYFWKNFKLAISDLESSFFGLIHAILMCTAIVLVTIGAALTNLKPSDREKFKAQLVWYSIALLLIFISIPWPFSPLASRPYLY